MRSMSRDRNSVPVRWFQSVMTVAKHLTSMTVLAGALALLGAGPAGAAEPIGLAKPNGVAVASCTTGNTVATRAATFTTTVAQKPNSKTVAVRFSLMRAATNPPSVSRQIVLASWSGWTRSKPGRSALVVTRRVDGLTGPAEYYVRVQMRWYDKAGKTIATSSVKSGSCAQPGYGPDLSVGVARPPLPPAAPPPDPDNPSPTVAAESSMPTYAAGSPIGVTITNSGRDASRPATLTITGAGTVLATADVPAIASGASVLVTATPASCPPKAFVVVAVKASVKDVEPSYSNNSRTVGVCAS